MLKTETFTFGPFQENTYIVYNEKGNCLIIDPGCFTASEEQQLAAFIADRELVPVKLLNTHGHIDHILGNNFVYEKFGLAPYIHEKDLFQLKQLVAIGKLYGIPASPSPDPAGYLEEGDVVKLDDLNFKVLFTPGHSPGHVVFFEEKEGIIIGGDVLFYESIGRTDLPGGDHEQLLESIREKLFTLGDHIEVYPGHGPVTTIGHEKMFNPFTQ